MGRPALLETNPEIEQAHADAPSATERWFGMVKPTKVGLIARVGAFDEQLGGNEEGEAGVQVLTGRDRPPLQDNSPAAEDNYVKLGESSVEAHMSHTNPD
jgi:hypothetical protein